MTEQSTYQQEPIAIVGYACRLPGGNTTPRKLWDFLERGDVASNKVPASRFNLGGHYDGSRKPGTMRPPGGMFLDGVDPADFDASFFEISGVDAIAIDPNQRQMLEVVYEALENAGLPLEKLDGAPIACFVGSFMSDYGDMQNRDPEDRAANNVIGVGRTVMANRLSYFLNIKGPSITIDTACSGSLVSLDMACRSVQSGEAEAAIVATSNLYLNPDHVMDMGSVGNAHSPTALCHTFDVSADGYVKAEAVSAVIVKRLSKAIQDGDPIRAIVRGTASTSNGRTGGIASPSSEAQAAAIRRAYANAGISDLSATAFLECHGTGTQAGDPTEVNGAGSVFAATRPADRPLIIGSIKGNVGHSEPSAGLSGLIKTIMALETGVIPGNPLFVNANPKIDFVKNRVKVSRNAVPWPDYGVTRRASVNSFGFGGSNAHAIIDEASAEQRSRYVASYRSAEEGWDMDNEDDEDTSAASRQQVLFLSANDAHSLRANIQALCGHLMNPRVQVSLPDLAYTLSERRTKLWHRAFVTTHGSTQFSEGDFTVAKKGSSPRVAFVFTGQGAQWPQMGKQLLEAFPWTRAILEELDQVLQSLPDPPRWSLVTELTEARSAEHLRQPEFSQPLVTALQICLVEVLKSWGVEPTSVIGHSSGEGAAAYAAGLMDRENTMKAIYFRGKAAVNRKAQTESDVGMLAVGLGTDAIAPYLARYADAAWIACYNSPNSLTISGRNAALLPLAADIKADGHFARPLLVDLPYHSQLMSAIGDEYQHLLENGGFAPGEAGDDVTGAPMYSSVTASKKTTPADALYWKTNMVSAVRFSEGLGELVANESPDVIIEIGPSGALAGPVSQVLKSMPQGKDVAYCSAWSRGGSASKTLLDVAGRLFVAGAAVDMTKVNRYGAGEAAPRVVVDLPNYGWNHTVKYWHENAASRDWRFKQFITHDLIGSKILGSSWHAPSWRKKLRLDDVAWLRDHVMGTDVIIPGTGLIAMALEAMYQKHRSLNPDDDIASPGDLCYSFRNVRFERALVCEEGPGTNIILTLTKMPGKRKEWHEFRISTETDNVTLEHCHGLVRVQDPIEDVLSGPDAAPLRSPTPARLWYKAQREIGLGFGPAFQGMRQIETTSGQHACRATVSMEPPQGPWDPASYYPIHPAVLDICLQTLAPALAAGERSALRDVLVPSLFDDFTINKVPRTLRQGLALTRAAFSGRGRPDQAKNFVSAVSVYDPATGALLMRGRGLKYAVLDVAPRPDPHVLGRVAWRPDVALLTQDQLAYLGPGEAEAGAGRLARVLDLVAHKKPTLAVLEVNVDAADTSCLWFHAVGDPAARSAYARYAFASTDATSLVSVQAQNEGRPNVSFVLASPGSPALGLLSGAGTYDLVIVKVDARTDTAATRELLLGLKPLLSQGAFMVVVSLTAVPPTPPADGDNDPLALAPSAMAPEAGDGLGDSEDDSSASDISSAGDSWSAVSTPASSMPSFIANAEKAIEGLAKRRLREQLAAAHDAFLNSVVTFRTEFGTAHLLRATEQEGQGAGSDAGAKWNLVVVRLDSGAPELSPSLKTALEASGWTVSQRRRAALENWVMPKRTVVLILDELSGAVMKKIDGAQWEALKGLVLAGAPLLWVTKGSQLRVTDPDNALVHGLFRVARREDAGASLTTLDLQSGTSPAAGWAIAQVLDLVRQQARGDGGGAVETEYAEHDGVLHIQRVLPDDKLNAFRRAETEGGAPVAKGFHATEAKVQIRADRIGALDFTWTETGPGAPAAPRADHIEVEVRTVGVNFKDVATTMGIVPENEWTIGCECAGVVRRVGPGVTKFAVGDRVCVMDRGTYANRLETHADRAHAVPAGMTLEEAATVPLVYMTALCALFRLGGLREGQSVLIHSAAGGVGLAAIQLARYRKADVFVTVGTAEKREFLGTAFGIPENRIFSSRDTRFATEIMRQTGGRGVDVILNSLTGELLDASWRICADGGTMVEIGKRDIVDRNSLSMEPFDRNCSFRAVDLSYTNHITTEMVASLFDEIFELLEGGHIKPISPIIPYTFDAVPSALAYIRRGQHIGKIVITNSDSDDFELPIRPAARDLQLRPDVSYLIVGGIKGLCGSLAVHMARHGARHIVVCSRSGICDEASAKVIRDCASYGCDIVEAKGDVADASFVRDTFKAAHSTYRIAGVIQGAMVLRDKPYESMTVQDYHEAIEAKVQGTWNLHRASLEQEPLDFFTMLSSVSGVVGNKGQANYAAANAFLDAFATYRRAHGAKANTVDLGAIEDVGYVAEAGAALEDRFDRRQWTLLNEAALRRVLGYSIHQQGAVGDAVPNPASAAQLVTGIAYPQPRDGSSDLGADARFGYLFSRAGGDGPAADADARGGADDAAAQALQAFRLLHAAGAEPAALAKAAVGLLAERVARVLRLETELEPGKPLIAYGLDSLSAVEIRSWLRAKLQVELSTLDITNASSLFALCDKLVTKLPQPEAASSA